MYVGSSSLTRDRTQAPCIGSMESYPLCHQGSPPSYFFKLIDCYLYLAIPSLIHTKLNYGLFLGILYIDKVFLRFNSPGIVLKPGNAKSSVKAQIKGHHVRVEFSGPVDQTGLLSFCCPTAQYDCFNLVLNTGTALYCTSLFNVNS